LREGQVAIAATTPFADIAAGAAAVIVVSAVFWRSRFKYGLRGYRFVLLEAGHVAQNILLAAAALGLAAVPLGGFYDRRVDELLGVNGVDESALYLLCVGLPEQP
jgi:SagB-type dehydrogenase family enzyme